MNTPVANDQRARLLNVQKTHVEAFQRIEPLAKKKFTSEQYELYAAWREAQLHFDEVRATTEPGEGWEEAQRKRDHAVGAFWHMFLSLEQEK